MPNGRSGVTVVELKRADTVEPSYEVMEPAKARRTYSKVEIDAVIERAIQPLESWPTVADPEHYIESRLGKYIKILEGMLERSLMLGDIDRVEALTLDLIRLSKLGHAKADVQIGVSKLREELNFGQLNTEAIREKLKEIQEVAK